MQRNSRATARGRNLRRTVPRLDSKRITTGLAPRGNFDPPRIVATPWNSLVVSLQLEGTTEAKIKCLGTTELLNAFALQTGTTGTRIDFRIVSAQVWHLIPNGEINNSLNVRFFSSRGPTEACGTNYCISQQLDAGTLTRPATVKFVWPLAESSFPLPSISAQNILSVNLGISQTVLVHLRVLWRSQGKGVVKFKSDGSHSIVHGWGDPAGNDGSIEDGLSTSFDYLTV